MLNNAYILISEDLKNSKKEELQDKIKIFNEFTLAVDRMIAGEYVDTEYEGKPISKDYLEYIHKNKTGAFLKLSVRMGAILANAPKEDINLLEKFGEKLGLAFQIKDDILDVIGSTEKLGKNVLSDKENDKTNFITMHGLDYCIKECEKLTNESIKILDSLSVDTEALKFLTKKLLDREN